MWPLQQILVSSSTEDTPVSKLNHLMGEFIYFCSPMMTIILRTCVVASWEQHGYFALNHMDHLHLGLLQIKTGQHAPTLWSQTYWALQVFMSAAWEEISSVCRQFIDSFNFISQPNTVAEYQPACTFWLCECDWRSIWDCCKVNLWMQR